MPFDYSLDFESIHSGSTLSSIGSGAASKARCWSSRDKTGRWAPPAAVAGEEEPEEFEIGWEEDE